MPNDDEYTDDDLPEDNQYDNTRQTYYTPPLDEYTRGGYSFDDYGGHRPTKSQSEMKYLLGTDEVPDRVKRTELWAIVSRHLQLIRIDDPRDLPYFRREIRDIIRTAMWNRNMRKTPYSDLRQIEFFSEMLLRKSIERGERILLATQITRSQVEDLGERSPSSGGSMGGQSQITGGGLFGSIRRFIGGNR